MTTRTRFTGEMAPCGKTANGEHVRDEDPDGFVIDHIRFDCGCHRTSRQFHDGGFHLRVVDHHGRVRTDEHSSTHEA